jgi:hypothetical protein
MTLTEKLEKLRDMKLEFSAIENEMKQLEAEIKAELLETGEKPDVQGVKITYRKGSESVRWDSKALVGYAAAHPEIEQFMTLTTTRPSVAFKFGL